MGRLRQSNLCLLQSVATPLACRHGLKTAARVTARAARFERRRRTQAGIVQRGGDGAVGGRGLAWRRRGVAGADVGRIGIGGIIVAGMNVTHLRQQTAAGASWMQPKNDEEEAKG